MCKWEWSCSVYLIELLLMCALREKKSSVVAGTWGGIIISKSVVVFALLVVGCEWVRIWSHGGQMFSSEVRRNGGAPGGKSWRTALGTVLGFLAWHHCVLWPSDTCVMTPQHHENHGVSLKRDMKVKKKKTKQNMPSAERLSREGMRPRKQMETLSSLCTVRPWDMLSLLPRPKTN